MLPWTTPLGFDGITQRLAARWDLERRSLSRVLDAEPVATLREAMLWPLDLAPIVPKTRPGEDVVVVLHGFLASAGVFRPMRARLEREAHVRVASFTHAPGCGVRRISAQLAEFVDRIAPHARVHIVGHSLGGIVARWYVQELGGHRRVAQTISLASPFAGTRVVQRLPWFVGADLSEESEILSRLRARARSVDVPHTSIIAGSDRVIVPTESAAFAVGEVIHMPDRGHNMLLFDKEVLGHIVARLRNTRQVAA